jgi:AraC-like DNA-binding protein
MYQPMLLWRERPSDSQFIESVWTCSTPAANSRTVLADPCISIQLVNDNGRKHVVLAGPRSKSLQRVLTSGYVCIAIRLKPGVFLEGFPVQKLVDNSFTFPADSKSWFRFGGKRLRFPAFEDAEELISQLYDSGLLGYETPHGLNEVADSVSPRTYSRQIQRATGFSPYQLFQIQRMYQAFQLLKQGMSAIEVASELDFVDQSHLTRASKQFFGHTPKQLPELPQTPQR